MMHTRKKFFKVMLYRITVRDLNYVQGKTYKHNTIKEKNTVNI